MSLDDRLRRGLRAAAHTATVDPDGDVAAGRRLVARHRRRAQLLAGAAATVLVLAGAVTATRLTGDDGRGTDDPTVVGDDDVERGEEPPGPTAPPASDDIPVDEAPPPARVSSPGGETLELDPFTFCYSNLCADGMPPDPLPDIGSADELRVDFALPDWAFQATFRPVDQECGREETVDLAALGDGAHVLRPAGPAGTYDVTLFGRGNGDAVYAFRWTTTADGPSAAPEARLALLADHDGLVDSYGVELVLDHLAATPTAASATITTRAADGRTHTSGFVGQPDLCPAGTVSWIDGTPANLLPAVGGGTPVAEAGPFTYEVVLTMDGARYTGTATWPDDVIPGNEPSVALEFEPALPALPSP